MRFGWIILLASCAHPQSARTVETVPFELEPPQACAKDDIEQCDVRCRLGSGQSCAYEGMLAQDDRARAKDAYQRGCDLLDGPSCYLLWLGWPNTPEGKIAEARVKDKLFMQTRRPRRL